MEVDAIFGVILSVLKSEIIFLCTQCIWEWDTGKLGSLELECV